MSNTKLQGIFFFVVLVTVAVFIWEQDLKSLASVFLIVSAHSILNKSI